MLISNSRNLMLVFCLLAIVGLVSCGDEAAPEDSPAAEVTQSTPPGSRTTAQPPASAPQAQTANQKLILAYIKNDDSNIFVAIKPYLIKLQTQHNGELESLPLDVSNPEKEAASAELARQRNVLDFFEEKKSQPGSVAIIGGEGVIEHVEYDPTSRTLERNFTTEFNRAFNAAKARSRPQSNVGADAGGQGAGAGANAEQLRSLEERISKLERPAQKQEGLVSRLMGPLGFAVLGLMSLAAIGLSLLSFFFLKEKSAQFKRETEGVKKYVHSAINSPQGAAAKSSGAPAPPAPSSGVGVSSSALDGISQKVEKHQQSLALLTQQIGSLENRAAAGEKRTTDSLQAVEQLTRWLARLHMHGAEADGFDDENERAAALAALERSSERLRANASFVEPLTQAIANLVERLEARPSVSPELLSRVQRLYHDIGQFDQWAVTAGAQLGALKRGSMDERRVKFQSEQKQLGAQFQAGQINFAQYVEQFRKTVEHHFPAGAGNGRSGEQSSPTLSEEQLRQYVEGAPEYLMDWFSNFSQLQSQAQAAQATGAGIDSETIDALAQVQSVGREVLNRFDIQPEEIYVGRTSYDRHLHDAAMVRQTTQFPANTVIEVHRAGFRRVSTGEVLRRPQVIVAGSGA